MRRALVVGATLVLAGAAGPTGQAQDPSQAPFHATRAFTAGAQAYPVESAPGTRETEVKVRQLATTAIASNPPPDAFARAATNDMGLAEAYVGQQGPSADADTATADGENDDVVDDGGNRLEAHVDVAPRARASAAGNAVGDDATSSGTGSSTSEADASGERLVATAQAEVNDVAVGLLVVGSGRFDARVESDGTPGGASASGLIRTSDATFADIPVTIGADGLSVDESRVPDAAVGPATAALQQAFSEGGYTDIRVVQPRVEVAEDGSSARVFGGGVFVFLTNNDPSERYFVSYTLLGGSAEVVFGGDIAVPAPGAAVPVPATEPADTVAPDAASTTGDGEQAAPVTPPAAPGPAPTAAELAYDEGAERVSLPVPWPGWVWAVVVVALAWAVAGGLHLPFAAGAQRRLHDMTDAFADRYLRG